ncbi:MAG: DMT family transporter [Gammaproteobacteria bacterium]|nr:DMT family transporter [Gammaproteobacteria bacterium]
MSKNWAYLMLAGCALFWSGNFVIGRAFAADIQPITISYFRWFTALLVILPFTIKSLISQWSIIRANLLRLMFMGALGVAGFNTFAYLGLHQTTATNALLINSFIPILIILLSRIAPGTPITAVKFIGILISTCGVLLLVSRGEIDNLIAFKINQGDLWVLLAAFVWAVYSISLRWRPAELTAPAFLSFTMIVGVLILSPVYWLNLLDEPSFVVNTPNVIAIAYVALFASIGAYLFWNQGVKIVGAGTAGQFIHLMPVFGTIMAVVFLGERLYWFHIAGAFAIGSGIYLSLRRAR